MPILELPNTPPSDGISFDFEQAKELMLSPLYVNPDLSLGMTITDQYPTKQQMAFSNPFGLSGKAGQCAAVEDLEMSTFEKFIDPQDVKGGGSQCWDDFKKSLFAFYQRAGMRKYNLEENTEWQRVLTYYLVDAFRQNLPLRLWFSDTAYTGTMPDGVTSADFFNIYDGLFKKIYADTSIQANKVAIAENAEATKAAQLNLAADRAYLVFQQMVQKADTRLRSQVSTILCTSTLFFNYKNYLENQSFQFTLDRVEGGFQRLSYNGLEIIEYNLWDRVIQSYLDDGTTYDLPHRALMLDPTNVMAQVDVGTVPSGDAIDTWFEKKEGKQYYQWASREDVQFGYSFMIQAAY